MNDFEITKREILFSVIIICLALCLGIWISNAIDEHFTEEEEKYNKALKINNDNDEFAYAINTSIGNVINYGKFEVEKPISDNWLKNTYTAYEKNTERYTMHTRTVCSGSGKHRHCHIETYYTWDNINLDRHYADNIIFSGVKFSINQFQGYPWETLEISKKTINDGCGYLKGNYIYEKNRIISSHVGDKRYYYKIIPTTFYGTTFGVAKDKKYIAENNGKIEISNNNLKEFISVEKSNKSIYKIAFWIFYIFLIGMGIYYFYVYENDWLED